MPLSEYYLLHSSAHYTDSRVKNNSLFPTMEQTLNVRRLCLLNYNLQLTTRDCINTLPTRSHKNHLHIKQIIGLISSSVAACVTYTFKKMLWKQEIVFSFVVIL